MALKIILDILLCAIMAAGAVLGIKYGFIQIAAKPLKAIAALALAFLACKGIGTAVISPMLQAPVTNYIRDFMYANCAGLTADNAATELPTLLKIAGAIFNVDIEQIAEGSGATVLDNIIENFTSPVVNVISVIIAFILIFFIVKLLCALAVILVNRVFKDGILGKINKGMGLVLATGLAFMLAWGFAVVVEFFFHLPMFEGSEAIMKFGDGGFIYRFFNTLNPLELLLSF